MKLAFQRDMNVMEQLKYDKKFTQWLEVHSLKKYITERTWKMYYDNIPKLLKALNVEKRYSALKMRSSSSYMTVFRFAVKQATRSIG